MTKQSPVITLLDLVYEESCKGTNHAWSRINNAMRSALEIAIGGGFEWNLNDFAHIMLSYKSGYWIGDGGEERWYAQCVASCNKSAIDSFESFFERAAFIADDVEPVECRIAHMTGTRKRERLAVGSRLMWKGQRIIVNSFAADGSHLNATDWIGYTTGKNPTRKIKRYKITRQMIIEDRAERKVKK